MLRTRINAKCLDQQKQDSYTGYKYLFILKDTLQKYKVKKVTLKHYIQAEIPATNKS